MTTTHNTYCSLATIGNSRLLQVFVGSSDTLAALSGGQSLAVQLSYYKGKPISSEQGDKGGREEGGKGREEGGKREGRGRVNTYILASCLREGTSFLAMVCSLNTS